MLSTWICNVYINVSWCDLSNQNLSNKVSKTCDVEGHQSLVTSLVCSALSFSEHLRSLYDAMLSAWICMFHQCFMIVIYQTRNCLLRYLQVSKILILKVITLKSRHWSVLLCHFQSICNPL